MVKKGFMLLEVILSVLIIASGLLFVIRSYSTSLKAAEVSRSLAKIPLFLEEKLFELDAQGFQDGVEEGESDGIFEGEENYSWSLTAQPSDDKETIKINKVDLYVTYAKARHARRVAISTFLKHKEAD